MRPMVRHPISYISLSISGAEFDQSSLISEYKILKEIGRGGFGAVMLAKHKVTGEHYALKFINADSYGGMNFGFQLIFQ